MPNHKFIRHRDDAITTADGLLTWLNEPNAGYWVTNDDTWRWVIELLKQPARGFDVKTITGTHDKEPLGYLFGIKGGRMNVSIRSPQTLDSWGLSDLPVDVLRQALAKYEKVFGVWVTGQPSTTGLRLIEKITKNRAPERPINMAPFEHAQDAQDFIWTRDLANGEREMSYLHAYDKRVAYLYSSDINLGLGEYVHEVAPNDSLHIEFNKNIPGVWRVDVTGEAPDGLPFPATNKRGWYYTPMVALFEKLGLCVHVREAYKFPRYQRVLLNWKELMVSAIKSMSEGDAVDRAVVKMGKRTFRQAIGLFGGLNRKDKTEWSYRPDWRGMIVSDASARIYYGTLKVRELTGQTPAAIYCDCLYYPSVNPNPHEATPFLTDAQLSRAYHYEATYDLGAQEAKALFVSDGRKTNFAEKIQAFELGAK